MHIHGAFGEKRTHTHFGQKSQSLSIRSGFDANTRHINKKRKQRIQRARKTTIEIGFVDEEENDSEHQPATHIQQ